MLLEREAGLEDRRGRELGVDLRDPLVGAVVEAAVDADRAVDAVHHPRAARREPPQPRKSKLNELKRQAGVPPEMRFSSTASPRRLELARERTEELVPAARGRRRELVEERQVGACRARVRSQVDFGADPPASGAACSGAPRARCSWAARRTR